MRVGDEQALFPLLLALPVNWTLANRKFLGQIIPLRVFSNFYLFILIFLVFRDWKSKEKKIQWEGKRKIEGKDQERNHQVEDKHM